MPDSLREKSLAGVVNLPHNPAQPTQAHASSDSLRGLGRISGRSLTWVDVLASPPLSDVREPYTMCLWSYRRKSLRLSRHWSASFRHVGSRAIFGSRDQDCSLLLGWASRQVTAM